MALHILRLAGLQCEGASLSMTSSAIFYPGHRLTSRAQRRLAHATLQTDTRWRLIVLVSIWLVNLLPVRCLRFEEPHLPSALSRLQGFSHQLYTQRHRPNTMEETYVLRVHPLFIYFPLHQAA
jgi:hypothetical protein